FELFEDSPPLDVLLVPVGGGGLIAGVALVAKALSPSTRVVGVQADRFCAMTQLFQRRLGGVVAADDQLPDPVLGPFGADTLADGIAVKSPGKITRRMIVEHVDEMLLVDEGNIERACNALLELEK